MTANRLSAATLTSLLLLSGCATDRTSSPKLEDPRSVSLLSVQPDRTAIDSLASGMRSVQDMRVDLATLRASILLQAPEASRGALAKEMADGVRVTATSSRTAAALWKRYNQLEIAIARREQREAATRLAPVIRTPVWIAASPTELPGKAKALVVRTPSRADGEPDAIIIVSPSGTGRELIAALAMLRQQFASSGRNAVSSSIKGVQTASEANPTLVRLGETQLFAARNGAIRTVPVAGAVRGQWYALPLKMQPVSAAVSK